MGMSCRTKSRFYEQKYEAASTMGFLLNLLGGVCLDFMRRMDTSTGCKNVFLCGMFEELWSTDLGSTGMESDEE